MRLKTNGKEFAEISIGEIRGNQGLGFHRLQIEFEFQIKEQPQGPQTTIIQLGGDLHLAPYSDVRAYLGRLAPCSYFHPISSNPQSSSRKERLEIELDPRRLESIEEKRDGGDIGIAVDLCGMYVIDNRHGAFQVQGEKRLPQGAWTEILGQMGYMEYLLIEVPMPDKDISPEFAEAVNHLAAAKTALFNGHYKEAVSCCRLTLDAIRTAKGDKHLKNTDWIQCIEKTKILDKPERIRLIRRALYDLSSAAHHDDEVCRKFDWDRKDAVAMISMMATLIKWLC